MVPDESQWFWVTGDEPMKNSLEVEALVESDSLSLAGGALDSLLLRFAGLSTFFCLPSAVDFAREFPAISSDTHGMRGGVCSGFGGG
jgi:hypothetical protein